MALTRRAAAAPKFEEQPAAAAVPAASAAAPTEAATPAAAPTPAPVPTPAQTGLVPVQTKLPDLKKPQTMVVMGQAHEILDSLRDALRVDWNTLTRLKANQGRIMAEIGSGVNLGEWVDFELLSYQDNYLISPGGDSDEAKTLARYSDDGKMLKDDARSCEEYLNWLKKEMGYEDARMSKRVILVASLLDCDKDATIDDGMLFQIDLPPTSRGKFETYRNQVAFDLAKGRVSPDQILRIRATATVEQQRGDKSKEYTLLAFSRAPAAA